MNKNNQILYFPYLNLKNYSKVNFFGLCLISSSEISNQNYLNDSEKEFLSKLLSVNRKSDNQENNILLIGRYRKIILQSPESPYNNLIDEFRKILFLTSVSASNFQTKKFGGNFFALSDNFTLFKQNFIFKSDWFSYSAGSIVKKTDGGYKIGEYTFNAPPHILLNFLTIDFELLKSLKFLKKKKRRIYTIILRSVDEMIQSFYNTDDINLSTRILNQARCFEILFQIPNDNQRKFFKEQISKLCESRNERNVRYKYEAFNGKKWEIGTRHKLWADRFYTLRNHIIHGNKILNSEYKFFTQPHYLLALWFFVISIKQLINKELNQKLFYDKLHFEKDKFVLETGLVEKSIDIYKQLNGV